jgi:hypothetical protein
LLAVDLLDVDTPVVDAVSFIGVSVAVVGLAGAVVGKNVRGRWWKIQWWRECRKKEVESRRRPPTSG